MITNTVDWGPGPPQGPGAPENFVWKTSKSGFGAAYAYVDTNGTQRAFVSANEARPENTKYSWGLFEIELPIVVPDECWNMGLNTANHNWCSNIVEVSISAQATTTGSTAAARASSSRPSRRRPADSRPTTT